VICVVSVCDFLDHEIVDYTVDRNTQTKTRQKKNFSSVDADKQFAADSDNLTVLVESITKTVVKLQYYNTVN
jgi:hypothetical protein